MKKVINLYKKNYIIVNSLLFSIIICFMSPLNPIFHRIIGTDSFVFQYGGYGIKNNLIPYRDFFDHKGIFIYIINFIGIVINKNFGVWLIEVIFMIISLIYAQKIVGFFTKNIKLNLLCVLVCFSFFAQYFEGGNLVEEYAIPFIMISSYIFIDYIINNNISKYKVVIIGILFSIVALLRVNMVAIWGIYIIGITIELIKEKEYKNLINYSLMFILGIIIVCVPIIIYLCINNAFSESIYNYFIFNFKYSNVGNFEKYESFKTFVLNIFVYTSIFMSLYMIKRNTIKKENKYIFFISIIVLFINILFMSISGKTYPHYQMINIPIYIVLLSTFFGEFETEKQETIKLIIYSVFIIKILIPNTIMFIDNIVNIKRCDDTPKKELIDLVKQETNENDKISVFGNSDYIYVLSNRLSASKYSYQFPICNVDTKIYNDYLNEITTNKPKLVLIQTDKGNIEDLKFRLLEMKYVEIKENIYKLD